MAKLKVMAFNRIVHIKVGVINNIHEKTDSETTAVL